MVLKYSGKQIFGTNKIKTLIILLIVFLGGLLWPRDPVFKNEFSTIVYDYHHIPLSVFTNNSGQWQYPPEKNAPIPEKLKQCVLTFEDQWFYRHPGINPFAVARALWQDVRAGKIISGASTITMQVARISHPEKRTWLNKFWEAYTALWLEVHHSKQEILRMYLTHAPYGGNIVGYRTAGFRYFGKEPGELTWAEAALLAVLPNAPGLMTPGKNRNLLIQKRNRLLKRLIKNNIISMETYKLAVREPIPGHLFPFPRRIPHLASHLASNPAWKGKAVFTTIDASIQNKAKRIAKRQSKYLEQLDIHNLAFLICDTQSGAIRAYVGSPDFFDRQNNGMVDGVRAPRSSGSVLKPFLYALAMDKGLILPESKIRDIPTYYGPFSPSNADKKFRGLIRANDALKFSLNVPAVRLLYSYGQADFYEDLKILGLKHLFRSAGDYGLPLIIGGAEVTVWEMARLYRGLGRMGRFGNLHYIKNSTPSNDKQLISQGAAYRILNVLKNLRRPGSEYYLQLLEQERPIAWKTGTSYGQRDAWAIGVTPRWTISVWVGNFNGEGNPQLSGAQSAGPVLFDLFNMLSNDSGKIWFKEPVPALKTETLCAYSGYRATENCPKQIRVKAPVNAPVLKPCPWHKTLFVDDTHSWEVCSLCWTPGKYHTEKKLILPADVAQFLRNSGTIIPQTPEHNPNCPVHQNQNDLQILYPTPGAHLWVPRDYNGKYQRVVARAARAKPDGRIYWYLDERYLGFTQRKNEMALDLSIGKHRLLCLDDEGNQASCTFYSAKK